MAKKVTKGVASPVPLPAFGRPVGFDLEIGDWTQPYGRGATSDILFQLDGQTDEAGEAHEASLRISFSNPKDGLLLHERNKGSGLRLPYLAPQESYMSEMIKHKSRVKASATGFNRHDKVVDDTGADENYFLRVRSVVDKNGQIVAANYAKVYGGFRWFVTGEISFQYHFNPKPNDRNLEFDPTKNLLKLPKQQQVSDP